LAIDRHTKYLIDRIAMRYTMPSSATVAILMVASARAFTLQPAHVTKPRAPVGLLSSFEDNGQSPAQKKQEQIMEMSAINGADEIRKLGVAERTKRAMLAEAVEDRIFELVDELEELVGKNNGLENLSDEVREEAVELAKQTKALQIQYDDLVNGRPSQLLE